MSLCKVMSSTRADQSVLFTVVSPGSRIAPGPLGLPTAGRGVGNDDTAAVSDQESEPSIQFCTQRASGAPGLRPILLPEGVQGVPREVTFELDLEDRNKFFSKSRATGKLIPGSGNMKLIPGSEKGWEAGQV